MRPKLEIAKTIEQAAIAVDEMFNSAYQTVGEDSGDDSDDEGERRDDGQAEEDDGEEEGEMDIPVRTPHLTLLIRTTNRCTPEVGRSASVSRSRSSSLCK